MRLSAKVLLATAFLAVPAQASAATKSAQALEPPPLVPGRALDAAIGKRPLLVQIERTRLRSALPLLRSAGATRLSRSLEIWRLPTREAARALRELTALGALRAATPNRSLRFSLRADLTLPTDPLVTDEWWLAAIGADSVEPPGPGVPITVMDSGLDLTNPEFVSRPNTIALNEQSVLDGWEEFHGTAVSSVAAATKNDVGVVGVYPQAILQAWDTGTLTLDEFIAGLETTSKRGPSVISISFGGTESDFIEQEAVLAAFARGSLIVVSAGNERAEGNPDEYPADYPHVLTVGASLPTGEPAPFSNSSPAIDLTAPGVDIPVAVTSVFDPTGYEYCGRTSVPGYALCDGTSFSTPMVSAAAAWVWTVRPTLDVTQIFDLMRWSARDIAAPGFDPDSGYGLLDIPNALAFTAPPKDPFEPNDDIYLVKPNGLRAAGSPLLVSGTRKRATVNARLDANEDPEDVYRIWVGPKKSVRVSLKPNANAQLEAWSSKTVSIAEQGAQMKKHLIAYSERPGTTVDRITLKNASKKGAFYYIDVYLGLDVRRADYTLSLEPAPKNP